MTNALKERNTIQWDWGWKEANRSGESENGLEKWEAMILKMRQDNLEPHYPRWQPLATCG